MRVPVSYKGAIQVFMSEVCTQKCYRGSKFFFLKHSIKGSGRSATLVHDKYTKGRAKKKEKRRKIRDGLRVLTKFMSTR